MLECNDFLVAPGRHGCACCAVPTHRQPSSPAATCNTIEQRLKGLHGRDVLHSSFHRCSRQRPCASRAGQCYLGLDNCQAPDAVDGADVEGCSLRQAASRSHRSPSCMGLGSSRPCASAAGPVNAIRKQWSNSAWRNGEADKRNAPVPVAPGVACIKSRTQADHAEPLQLHYYKRVGHSLTA